MKSFKIFLEQRNAKLYDELLNEGSWDDIKVAFKNAFNRYAKPSAATAVLATAALTGGELLSKKPHEPKEPPAIVNTNKPIDWSDAIKKNKEKTNEPIDWSDAVKNSKENTIEKAAIEKAAIEKANEIGHYLEPGIPSRQDDGNIYILIPYGSIKSKEKAHKDATDLGAKILRKEGFGENKKIAKVDYRDRSIILVVKDNNN
jgi:hypothetical protein